MITVTILKRNIEEDVDRALALGEINTADWQLIVALAIRAIDTGIDMQFVKHSQYGDSVRGPHDILEADQGRYGLTEY